MKLIYITENNQYSPISHGASYLWDKFDRIQSFLRSQLKPSELNHLAQPILNGENMEWYAVYDQKMQLLSTYSAPFQQQIEQEYLTLIQKINSISKALLNNNDPEKKAWGHLIKDTFNIENNMLISDGSNWAIIWGCEFRNQLQFGNTDFESDQIKPTETPKEELKEEPQQIIQPIEPIENAEPVKTLHFENTKTDNNPVQDGILVDDEVFVEDDETPTAEKSRLSFWQYIKRFFRWLAYRFWGLMLLIIYTLLIIFLTKQCTKKPDCSEFQKVERELKFLEGRIKERCSENIELNSENQ